VGQSFSFASELPLGPQLALLPMNHREFLAIRVGQKADCPAEAAPLQRRIKSLQASVVGLWPAKEYSEEARIARLTGTFTVSFVVAEDGTVRDARPVTSPGLGLAEEAIEAVSSWRFKPV
jgi:TonB family protein